MNVRTILRAVRDEPVAEKTAYLRGVARAFRDAADLARETTVESPETGDEIQVVTDAMRGLADRLDVAAQEIGHEALRAAVSA